ncbi:MAG: TetR family transcriptional regulator C-terminal domain-containing protein [Lutibacter sp.]|nr:TetR family transcriptional regulator C-terminal domain-containing protein [Lutibacter sp.]
MKAKKKLTANMLFSNYMNYVLENNANPVSVYSFAKENNFDEAEFYKFYGSFEALEKAIFATFFDNTLEMLSKSEEFQAFDARNKLLSFYFTFFEILTANRSYVVYALKMHKNNMKALGKLYDLKHRFTQFVSELEIEMIDVKQDKLKKFQEKSLEESAWIQLLITMKFWLDDISASFEKTDIFIEKSLNASFDLINVQPLKSIIDLGKFLFKEKMNPRV